MSNFDLAHTTYTEIPSEGIFGYYRFVSGDRTYVLKTLKEAYRDKRQYHALLKKEYEAVTRLHATSLPAYYELIDDPDRGRCIVEEYIDGRTLADYIAEGHSEEEREAVARRLLAAVQELHAHYVPHRNLSPAHVLITHQGDGVRLVGFRPLFADEIQAPYASTRYLAPEQKDETVAVDTRADVYSLGLLLRQLQLSGQCQTAVTQCCSLGRGDRYMCAGDVLTALDSRPPMPVGKVLKPIALVLVLAVVVGVIVYFVRSGGASTGTDEPAEATSYVLPDTVQGDTTHQVAAIDTAAVAATTGCNVDSVKNVIAARLEAIYRPYEGDSVGDHSMQAIRSQVRNCYYSVMRRLDNATPDDRSEIDNYFARYRRNKDAALLRK